MTRRSDDHKEDFYARLATLVAASGLSLRAVGKAAGIDFRTVSDWTRGRHLPQKDDDLISVVRVCLASAQKNGPVKAGWLSNEQWIENLNAARQHRQQTDTKITRPEQTGTRYTRKHEFPFVRDANVGVRVHRAVVPVPYIERDKEGEIRAHLESGRPVLLVGSSMVGKTKMASVLIEDMFASRRIFIPEDKTTIARIGLAHPALRDMVIWLDDIDRLVGSDGITDGMLRRLSAAGNVIVGTMRATDYYRFQPTDRFRPPEWDAICIFERVFISRELSVQECERIKEVIDDHETEERIRRCGVGEYVGAAERIDEALRLGPAVNPVGHALVRGAADWQRAGITRPIPISVLMALAVPHLDIRGRLSLSDQQTVEAALKWATQDINPTVSLLERSGQDIFTIFDYALDLICREEAPVPDATWQIAIDNATPPELISVGFMAQANRRMDFAKQAWRKAAASGDSNVVLEVSLANGVMLLEEGDVEGAHATFQQLIDSGHPRLAPGAAFQLGLLLKEQMDAEGAQVAFRLAIDSGHEHMAPMAGAELGLLLQEQGNTDDARAIYAQVLASGRPWPALPRHCSSDSYSRRSTRSRPGSCSRRRSTSETMKHLLGQPFNLDCSLKRKETWMAPRAASSR